MPQEHEIPAPVTTMIFLHLATARDRLDSVLLVVASEVDASRSSVIVIAFAGRKEGARREGIDMRGAGWGVDGGKRAVGA